MTDVPDDAATLVRLADAWTRLRTAVGGVVVGQEEVIEQVMLCILARSHAILEGVPGLAKTLLVSTLSRCLGVRFNRIQFTPDLMPTDITGTEVIQEDKATGERAFRFLPGPVFANLLLADEINRTPPKTQAALLEAMQERHVTAGGQVHALPDPFFVLATQNPVEQEGTYPLPEAQQDCFLFKITVGYPAWDDEMEVVRRTTGASRPAPSAVLSADELRALQDVVRRIPVADHVIAYALRLVRATRQGDPCQPAFLANKLSWGAGPRAAQGLVLAAKARAALHGRPTATVDDVAAVAPPVLRHRLAPTFEAEAEGLSADAVVERLLREVPRNDGAIAAARG